MEFKGAMGGLYKLSEWIMRIVGGNFLWLVCSSPFLFFLIMKVLLMQNPEMVNESLSMNWVMGIIAPFVLFPATGGLFSLVRKWVMGDSDVPIIKTYFRGYKENYKHSLIGGVFYTVLFFVIYIDYTVYMTRFESLQFVGIIMLLMMLLLALSLFNFFSMLVHYHMGVFQMIKNAILVTLIRPVRAIMTLAGTAAIIFIGFKYTFILVLCATCLIAWWSFFNFYAVYLKMQHQLEQKEEEIQIEQNGE